MAERKLRCAIYTRKSSEEGLEQDFNSLHAQREACEAYITSQKHEGWRLDPTPYDDGGFSGGNMDRPGLKQLLADIAAGAVDVVVVYKVDRLTRSLADFAKIVEIFDGNGVSFVSVTQSFNTTTSMGRLTLNVLLSFAQFEREVTGERIRDKIAASKAKGMWMGGNTPLGYRVQKRSLVIVPEHAAFVRHLFERYLALGSVEVLQRELVEQKIETPIRITEQGSKFGGALLSRGPLYHLLQNPVYRGKIRHKDIVHEGMHEAIIDVDLWDSVQTRLAENRHRERVSARAKHPSLLAGLLKLEGGRRLIASHAVKQGVRYRYYRSVPDKPDAPRQRGISFPAEVLEQAVTTALLRFLRDPSRILSLAPDISDRDHALRRAKILADDIEGRELVAQRGALIEIVETIEVGTSRLSIIVKTSALLSDGQPIAPYTLIEPIEFSRRGNELKIVLPANGMPEPEPDPALQKALGQAHRWWTDLTSGRYATLKELATAYDVHERYVPCALKLAFLSPELTAQLVRGTQPLDLTVTKLLWKLDVPPSWTSQSMLAGREI